MCFDMGGSHFRERGFTKRGVHRGFTKGGGGSQGVHKKGGSQKGGFTGGGGSQKGGFT